MTEPNEIRDDFLKKLDQITSDHKDELDDELKRLQDSLSKFNPKMAFHELQNEIAVKQSVFKKEQFPSPPPLPQNRQELMTNIASSDPLIALDKAFFSYFSLDSFFLPFEKVSYPTIYCDTLEDFYTAYIKDENVSELSRQFRLEELIEKATKNAKNHGGTLGVNIPGDACYINGWLIGEWAGIDPRQIPNIPEILKKEVLGYVAHEKLGHGFLSVYSALGQLKARFGFTLIEIAQKFELQIADDPIIQLSQQQSNVLFKVSQFLEEGWATWIEYFMKKNYLDQEITPYTKKTIKNISSYLPRNTRESFNKAFEILFSPAKVNLNDILNATNDLANIGMEFDELISSKIHQPLRYAIGELLCDQCAENFGSELVPYAVLIAANITFDPQKISLSDLQKLLTSDPRLNPDARLAAISKIKMDSPNNLIDFIEIINNGLSLSIPPEIRK